MKKYILKNYSEESHPITSPELPESDDSGIIDSGLIDSGLIDSGVLDSGIIDSGIVPEPDPIDPNDLEGFDDEEEFYTEEQMEEMKSQGKWKGGYVNGEYIPGDNASGTGGNSGGANVGGNPSGDGGSTGGNNSHDGGNTTSSSGIIMYLMGFPIYSEDAYVAMQNEGTWQGGYVQVESQNSESSIAYMYPGEVTITPSYPSTPSTGTELLNNALKFMGTPYELGGCSRDGIDCSGLVTVALGIPPENRWSTGSGPVPGMTLININTSLGYEAFKQELQVGDVLVWRNSGHGHAAIYVEGDTVVHASAHAYKKVVKAAVIRHFISEYGAYPKIYRLP